MWFEWGCSDCNRRGLLQEKKSRLKEPLVWGALVERNNTLLAAFARPLWSWGVVVVGLGSQAVLSGWSLGGRALNSKNSKYHL